MPSFIAKLGFLPLRAAGFIARIALFVTLRFGIGHIYAASARGRRRRSLPHHSLAAPFITGILPIFYPLL